MMNRLFRKMSRFFIGAGIFRRVTYKSPGAVPVTFLFFAQLGESPSHSHTGPVFRLNSEDVGGGV
jgi:hypothetical protein